MKNQTILLVILLTVLFSGCTSTLKQKAGDGAVFAHPYKEKLPINAQNEWAEILETDVTGFPTQFGFDIVMSFILFLKNLDVENVEIFDVTRGCQKINCEKTYLLKDKYRYFAGTKANSISSPEYSWLFIPRDTKKIFKFILTDLNGKQTTLYQPVIFTRERKLKYIEKNDSVSKDQSQESEKPEKNKKGKSRNRPGK